MSGVYWMPAFAGMTAELVGKPSTLLSPRPSLPHAKFESCDIDRLEDRGRRQHRIGRVHTRRCSVERRQRFLALGSTLSIQSHGRAEQRLHVAVVQAVVTALLAAWLLGVRINPNGLPLLVVAVTVGTAGWFFFYAIFALRLRRNDAFNTVTSVFYFVFLFASSMFYPIEPLPDAFRMAALINPITWQVDVLRYATIGYGTAGQIAIEGVAFIVFSLISFALAQQALWKQE